MKSNVVTINLTDGAIEEKAVDSTLWLGGRGLGARLLCDAADPACDPMGPGNAIVFAVSPVTGTSTPTAGRTHATFKSPLTGTVGSANSGGRWGVALKSAGIDALVVTGAAASPVYISIDGGDSAAARTIRIHDASHLWGKSVPETTAALESASGPKKSVMCIGPAGENLVRIASIMNDRNRAFGRGGPGAVMGSKNLKAVVVSGSKKTEVADRERFRDVIDQTRHVMKAVPATKRVMKELGTAGLVHLIDMMRMLPHRNFQDCRHEHELLDRISGEKITDRILVKSGGCYACPIQCQRHTRVGGRSGEGPEYETAVLMGPLVDIYDLEAVTLGNYAANELGIDTMSLGGTVACAAELAANGLISGADMGDIDLRFGNKDIYPGIVEMTAARSGIGDGIADGARILAAACGSPGTAMHIKGLELPAYDPRGLPAQALGYMTSPTGGCHLRGGYSISLAYFGGMKEVPRFSIRQAAITAKNQQDLGIIQDSMGVCRFTGYAVGADYWARLYSAVTGEETGREHLEDAAQRISALERLFNIRAGLDRTDDDLPARFKNEPVEIDGRGRVVSDDERNRMLDDYYYVRGWDAGGCPTGELLDRLEIER